MHLILLKRAERPKEDKKDGEPDESFWELLLSADKKDYERICAEHGITDFRGMLTKLKEKKKEREEEQSQVMCQSFIFPEIPRCNSVRAPI